MAKLSVVKGGQTAPTVKGEERRYVLSRETKGCWVYMWEPTPEGSTASNGRAPAGTEDWARKWYVLKRDFPICPGKTLKVTITPTE